MHPMMDDWLIATVPVVLLAYLARAALGARLTPWSAVWSVAAGLALTGALRQAMIFGEGIAGRLNPLAMAAEALVFLPSAVFALAILVFARRLPAATVPAEGS